MASHIFQPEELPSWVLRTELPTIVRERCDTAGQISVWLAIRWLLALQSRQSLSLGSREIAERAKVNVKSVSVYTTDLVRLGLLEIVGEEKVPGLKNKRPIYRIPRAIEEENATFTWQWLARHDAPSNAPPHDGQLALPLPDALLGGVTDPKTDQMTDPKTDQCHDASDPKTDQMTDPKTDQSDPKTDQMTDPKTDQSLIQKRISMDGRMDGRMEGGKRARAKKVGRPQSPPPTPEGHPPLSKHPLDLWTDVCTAPRRADDHNLARLAVEHDGPTNGYGWYFVGVAILMGAISQDIRSIGKLKTILGRWRSENSYGSDLETSKDNRYAQPSHPRRSPARSPGGTKPRPGDAAYYLDGLDTGARSAADEE
jgi:hypothetical protein